MQHSPIVNDFCAGIDQVSDAVSSSVLLQACGTTTVQVSSSSSTPCLE